LKPISSAVRHWPAVKLSDATSYYVRQGQPVLVPHAPTAGWVQIFEADASNHPGAFLGVGEILDDGRVAPRRLVLVQ
jgi:tRNA pseudouridine55 synthase